MMTMTDATIDAKPRKRAAAKTASRQPVAKTKLTVYINVETARKLGVFAAMTDADKSSIVESLLAAHVRRFVVQDRERGAAVESDDRATLVESAA